MKKSTKKLIVVLLLVGCGYYAYSLLALHNQVGLKAPVVGHEIVDVAQHEGSNWDQKKEITATTTYKVEVPEGVKRRKFVQNKLWRDNGAKQLEEQDGAIINRIILDDEKYNKQLGLKLIEEANEVAAAQTKKELISEIGDVYEVIDCLMKLHDISKDEVIAAQDKKRADRGSFLNREFVLSSEYLPGSFGEWYSLKDSRLIEILD